MGHIDWNHRSLPCQITIVQNNSVPFHFYVNFNKSASSSDFMVQSSGEGVLKIPPAYQSHLFKPDSIRYRLESEGTTFVSILVVFQNVSAYQDTLTKSEKDSVVSPSRSKLDIVHSSTDYQFDHEFYESKGNFIIGKSGGKSAISMKRGFIARNIEKLPSSSRMQLDLRNSLRIQDFNVKTQMCLNRKLEHQQMEREHAQNNLDRFIRRKQEVGGV